MGYQYDITDVDIYRASRPLHLLQWWKRIDHWCKTQVPDPSSRFRVDWIQRPWEFIIATIDGDLAGVVHIELKRKSADCHIIVGPEHQRTNLGYLLGLYGLQTVFVDERKPKAICSIGTNNRPAQRLATTLGFKRIACYNKRITYRLTWQEYQDRHGATNTHA